jgi:hypothetical protein
MRVKYRAAGEKKTEGRKDQHTGLIPSAARDLLLGFPKLVEKVARCARDEAGGSR